MSNEQWSDAMWLLGIFVTSLASLIRSMLNARKLDDTKDLLNGHLANKLREEYDKGYEHGESIGYELGYKQGTRDAG